MFKRKDVGASYVFFVRNLEEFYKIGFVFGYLNVEELNQSQGIEYSFKERKVLWYKTCRNSFSNENLERVKKRKYDRENEEENSDFFVIESIFSFVKVRRFGFLGSFFSSYCFFCELSDVLVNFYFVFIFEVDRRVRECVFVINDNRLIGKLASGDMVVIEVKYYAKCLVGLYN